MTIKQKLFAGFAFVLLLFMIDFMVNYRLNTEANQVSEYLTHSEVVIRNSNQLQKGVIDMQSGFRGYLLTGQESFLQSYYEGIHIIPGLFAEQRTLVTEQEQLQKLDSIELLHNRWIDYADQLISTKRDTLPQASKKYIELFETKLKMEVGKKLNDEIKKEFTEFDQHEYKVRQERRERQQKSSARTKFISITLAIISLGAGIFCALYLTKIITIRINKMVALAETISDGNLKVTIDDREKDELRKLSESLNIMATKLDKTFTDLEKKNKELDQFAYVVSHDLKAPLRGIENIIKWTEEDYRNELTKGVSENINLMKGRTLRMENLINGLLEYARIGRVNKAVEKVDVNALLKEVIEMVVPASFLVTIKGVMPTVYAQRVRIQQIFLNLLSNAVKHNDKASGNIIIACAELEEYFEFTIEDDGPGIEPAYHEKIFQIFQTLKEKDAFESTGVGLALVKKIIDDQKATIRVVSSPGKGTAFVFTWPKKPIINE